MKVLIADDELPIREWLRMSMEGIRESIEVHTAGNGKEAWALFQKEQPELVMTDIKMPRMTGLELLQRIKSEQPGTYVVMLTAYGEFEYAREAIRYQANEYILKNEITRESLTEILHNYDRSVQKRDGETLSLEGKGPFFAVAFPETEVSREEPESWLNSFVLRIDAVRAKKGSTLWICEYNAALSESARFYETMAFLKKLSGLWEVSVGFSGFVGTPEERCDRAWEALNRSFYEQRQCVCIWEKEEEQLREEILAERKRVVAWINQKRMDEAVARMEILYEKVEKAKLTDLEFVLNCFCDIVDACKVAHMEQAGSELGRSCRETKEKLCSAGKLEAVYGIFTQFFAELDGAVCEVNSQYGKYIQSALAYISDHYGTIESLTEVADYVHLNTEYFCRMFKAETGVTFGVYLTEFRIKKAVELLERTELKVYEVAERVGYTNLSYFSKVFKKVTGETPFALKNDIKSK